MLTFEPETLETQRLQKRVFWRRIQKYYEPKYWRVGSDDDFIKLTKKHVPIMIPLAQKPLSKFLKNFLF